MVPQTSDERPNPKSSRIGHPRPPKLYHILGDDTGWQSGILAIRQYGGSVGIMRQSERR